MEMPPGAMMDPNASRGSFMLEAVWIGVGIATVIMGLRLYTRIKVVGKVSLDDYLMVSSFVFAIISGAVITKGVAQGFGKHIYTLSPPQQSQAIKFAYLAQPLASMAQCFGRMSFAYFLVKVMGITKTRRWILYCIMAGQFMVNLVFITLNLRNCVPINKYWNPTLPGTCWSPHVIEYVGYVQGAWNVFSDLVLALLPALIVWGLNMRISTKIGLMFLLALGFFNMIAAIITTVEARNITANQDITYNYVVLDIWGTAQTYLVIVAASVPTIRPLFRESSWFSSSFFRSLFSKHVDESHEIGPVSSCYRNNPRKMGYSSHSDTSRKYPSADDLPTRCYGMQSSEENILPMQKPEDIRRTTKVSVSWRPYHGRSRESQERSGDDNLRVNHILPFDPRSTDGDDKV